MTDFNASRLGVANNDPGTFAKDNKLFLQVYGGEVLTAYAEEMVLMGMTRTRTLTEGYSARFPSTFRTTAEYHVPGTELLGQDILHNERIINADDELVSHVFIARIDELKNHYDVRQTYSFEMGKALARKEEQQKFQLMCLAARTATNLTGGDGGSQLVNANFVTDAATLLDGIFDGNVILDNKRVSRSGRYFATRPAYFSMLVRSKEPLNRDWGGSGSFAAGTIETVDGTKIIKSINIPSTNIASAEAGTNNTYHGDFSKTMGILFTSDVIGTVKLSGATTDMENMPSRRGTFMVTGMIQGHGILRPETAVEFVTA